MPHNVVSNQGRIVCFVSAIALVGAILLPVFASATPPKPLNVLFVANGWCSQEDDIENHFLDLGYDVTRINDLRVRGTTSFAVYDLIVLTESAPLMSAAGLSAIKASGKPVLVVESWTFLYAYRLGLTTSPIARLSEGNTVTSLVEGYTPFTSHVGAEALVHQTPALIFGVNPAHVKSTAVPLYQSTGCMPGLALFVDYAKKIGVTGISDTGSYTVDAWKMFDILVQQIVPAPPERETIQEVVQAYVDSGLPSLITQFERDLRQQPDSWMLEEVEREVWATTVEWRLDELWDFTVSQIYQIFGNSSFPGLFWVGYTSPERPNGAGANWLPLMTPFTSEHEFWFMGQNWEPAFPHAVAASPFYWSQFHAGTDLGLGANAKLNGRQYFYMGDTWDVGPSVHKWSERKCDVTAGARCDDMIVVSGDHDPSDGINAMPVLNYEPDAPGWRWTPVSIPGVHQGFSPQLDDDTAGLDYWMTPDEEPTYTAPTGAVVARLPFEIFEGTYFAAYVPVLVLTYGTAMKPDGYDVLNDTNPRTRPMSWMGCSLDGITFRACYRDDLGQVVPFSADVAPPSAALPGHAVTDNDPGAPARFIQVAAVEVNSSDFEGFCASATTATDICDFADSGGGLLLYGSGRPYRKSGLFLAFIRRADFGQVGPAGVPIVNYWTGSGWSFDETDAVPLKQPIGEAPPCDLWPQPNYQEDILTHTDGCWPELQGWDTPPVFGEISARLIRSTTDPLGSKVILLGSNDWSVLPDYGNNLRWVYGWNMSLSEPWGDDFVTTPPYTTNTAGYGPYIIDEFSDSTYPGSGPGSDIVLWHTISVWQGTVDTPYGVYTGSEVIPW